MAPDQPRNTSSETLKSGLSASEHAKTAEQEALQEEIRRRSALLEKKEAAYLAQAKKLELADQRMRELVRSEGEADYKSRTLAAKLASTERTLEELTQQKRGLERTLSKAHQDADKHRFEVQELKQRLSVLQDATQNRDQSADQRESKIRDLESKLSRTSSKIELYRGKIESLQRQLSDKDTEALLTHQKFELVQREQQRLKKDLEDNRQTARSYRESKTELEELVYQTQRKLADAEEELEKQALAVEKFAKAQQANESEFRQLEEELDAARAGRSESQQQVEELLEQLQAVEQYHAEEQEAVAQELQVLRNQENEWQEREQRLRAESAQESHEYRSLLEEKNSLASVCSEQQDQLTRFSKDLENKKRQVVELTRWAERVRPAYESLKQKFSELQSEYRQLHATYSESNSKIRQQAKLLDSLQTQEEERESELAHYGEQLEELHQELEFAQGDSEQKASSLAELEAQLQQVTEELSKARKRVENSQENSEQTESELLDLSELLEDVTQEKLNLEQRHAETEIELAEQRRQAELLEAQLGESKKQSSRLNHDLVQQQALASKAQSNLKELLRQRGQLLDAKKLLEDALTDAQAKEKSLKSMAKLLEEERDAAVQALDELQTEFEGVNLNWVNRIRELEDELQQATGQLEAERTQREELVEHSQQQQDSMEEQLQDLRAELLQGQEASVELTQQVGELTEVLDETQERLNETESDLQTLTSRADALELNLASAESEKEEIAKELSTTSERLTTTQSELDHHQKLLRKKAEEREKLVVNLEAASKQNKALRELVARSQKESLSLREYIDKLQTLSKERLEQAKRAIEKRDYQIKKQIHAAKDAQEQAYRVSRRLERSKLAEAALKGALTDLRVQLMEKDEMVEELEWHLGLVYQTLEDGQVDLEGKETELAELTSDLDRSEYELDYTKTKAEKFRSQLEEEEAEHQGLKQVYSDLESEFQELQAQLDSRSQELAEATFHLERTSARLERVMSDLTEEQDFSARLGAQLTDALRTRNRTVQRLGTLQREFSEWKVSKGEPENLDDRQEELEELATELSLSQDRELEMTSELHKLRREFERLRDYDNLPQTEHEPERVVTGDAELLASEVSAGVDLGAQVFSVQMDAMQANDRHQLLTDMMEKVDTQEALASLLEDLRVCEEERQLQAELVEALESEWQNFRDDISPEALELLSVVMDIVETEMRQSRAAEARVVALQIQLQNDNPTSDSPSELEELKEQLSERAALVEELENELDSVSGQLAEVSDRLAQQSPSGPGDSISWRETTALREELREKTELLERYREERLSSPSGVESLEEEIHNLNARYQQGRTRIVELLGELDERDRLLKAASDELPAAPAPVPTDEPELVPDTLTLSHSDELEPEAPSLDPALLSEEEFDLPLPPIEALSTDIETLPEPDFSVPEDTVEDLPAIPYPLEESLEEEDSVDGEGSTEGF